MVKINLLIVYFDMLFLIQIFYFKIKILKNCSPNKSLL